MSISKLTTSLRVLGAACLLAISSVSHATISAFSDDFEGYGTAGNPSVPDFNPPWLGFSDNCGFPGGYSFDPSTSGPQIAALGYNGVDNQYLNYYANYDNAPCHTGSGPNPQEEIFMYREFTFSGAEAANAETWVFSWNYREADVPPAGSTEVYAYIRVFDTVFNILKEVKLDTSGSSSWREGRLSVTMDPVWTDGGIFQVGFANKTGNYENSGMFYDDANLTLAQETPIDLTRSTVHPHHVGTCFPSGCFPDDVNTVIVFGQRTAAGDPTTLFVSTILPETLRFGPGFAPESPNYVPETVDRDSDGINDLRVRFQMSDTGFSCSETSTTLTAELNTGQAIVGTDTFTSNCDAVCHTGDFDLP